MTDVSPHFIMRLLEFLQILFAWTAVYLPLLRKLSL